jgi:hypothetical protein
MYLLIALSVRLLRQIDPFSVSSIISFELQIEYLNDAMSDLTSK